LKVNVYPNIYQPVILIDESFRTYKLNEGNAGGVVLGLFPNDIVAVFVKALSETKR
jgi:hypothetical protein